MVNYFFLAAGVSDLAVFAAVISASFFFCSSSFCILPPCRTNFFVGENSPSLCPTISSVTRTSRCVLPLYTPKRNPTISGEIWLERAHVFIIAAVDALLPTSFSKSLGSIYGPFFSDRVLWL